MSTAQKYLMRCIRYFKKQRDTYGWSNHRRHHTMRTVATFPIPFPPISAAPSPADIHTVRQADFVNPSG